jgi:hypothetical protein
MGITSFGIPELVVVLILLVPLLVLAFIPANIAKRKGYSFRFFWCAGLFFCIPATIVALALPHKTSCP